MSSSSLASRSASKEDECWGSGLPFRLMPNGRPVSPPSKGDPGVTSFWFTIDLWVRPHSRASAPPV